MFNEKYLHCLIDEKFLDGAISLFDTDERIINTYALFQNRCTEGVCKFIKNDKVKKYELKDFLFIVSSYGIVILHSLTSLPLEMISKIPQSIKVVW